MTRALAIFSAMLLLLGACDQRGLPPPPQQTVVVQAAPAVAPQDLSLETVVALLRSGVTDGASLEARINDPTSGINNVDFDRDGRVDYVMVREAQTATGTRMALIDHPSSGAGADQEVASITFDRGPAGVAVRAGYSPFVDPGGAYLYQDTLGSDLAFAQWLFMTRALYAPPIPVGYVYRSRLAPTVVESTRTTFRQETKVSPVRNTSPTPRAVAAAQPSPQRADVRQGVAPPKADGTLKGAAAGLSDFKVTDKPKPAALGFAPTPKASPPPSPPPAARAPAPSPPRPSTPKPSAPASKPSVASGRSR